MLSSFLLWCCFAFASEKSVLIAVAQDVGQLSTLVRFCDCAWTAFVGFRVLRLDVGCCFLYGNRGGGFWCLQLVLPLLFLVFFLWVWEPFYRR